MQVEVRPIMVSDMLGLPRAAQDGGGGGGGGPAPSGGMVATSSAVQTFLNNVVMVATHGQQQQQQRPEEIRSSVAGVWEGVCGAHGVEWWCGRMVWSLPP